MSASVEVTEPLQAEQQSEAVAVMVDDSPPPDAEIVKVIPPRPANPRHAFFAIRYATHQNVVLAQVDAGYKSTSSKGYELLRQPDVKAYVEWLLTDISLRNGSDEDFIVRILMAEAQNYGPSSSAAARMKACELLGKRIGLFKEQVDNTHRVILEPSLEDVLAAKNKMLEFRNKMAIADKPPSE